MSNLQKAFSSGKALIGFLTAGDPDLAATEQFALTLAKAGCDMLELGVPFSDPICEGEVIQRSNLRALRNDVNLDKIFALTSRIRKQCEMPLVLVSYLNPVYRYGYQAFFNSCANSGVNGVIISDLPFEERGELAPFAEKFGIDIISLVTSTSEQRGAGIARQAKGFVYCVSSSGACGKTEAGLSAMVSAVKKANPNVPVAAEADVFRQDQTAKIAAVSDGVITGGEMVQMVEEFGANAAERIAAFVREIKGVKQMVS